MMKYFSYMSVLISLVLLGLSFNLFFFVGWFIQNTEIIIEWSLFNFFSCQIIFILIFDYMSMFFLSVVSLISGSVLFFSVSYMSKEKFFSRFLMIVLSFIASMYLLILSPNIISLLLGWDGLGVTSYLLVVFYQSNKSYNAGMITALTNRLGDVGILICIGMMLFLGDWNYLLVSEINLSFNSMFLFILIISACTKSAQIPFSAWLPAAMAAPTPVSALVHSSTLVTAGVYLLIRFNYIIMGSTYSYFLMVIGILTMLMAGMAAMLEMDMKKIIALSTLSQLGVMMMVLGAQKPILAYFHLLSHAYFKAMLFMCAGMVIHNMKDYQDIRNMGNINNFMPILKSVINVSNISLCGIPFMSGFYSKDLILEMMLMDNLNLLNLFFILFATLLTVGYSCRMVFFVSLNTVNLESFYCGTDSDFFMVSGAMFLFPFSIFGGMVISWSLFNISSLVFMPFWMKSSILFLIFSTVFFMVIVYKYKIFWKTSLKVWFISNMWFMPLVFSTTLTKFSYNMSVNMMKVSEISWLENILYGEIFFFLKKMNKYLEFFSNSYILNAAFLFMLIFSCLSF